MDRMIAFCGLICSECPAFLATQKDSDAERKAVAEQWSKTFNHEVNPADINCDGCTSEVGRLFTHCTVCEVRKCSKEKHVENCAHCDEYPCDNLSSFFTMAPNAKTTLEEIRSGL